MSHRTLLLIFCLFCITAILFVVALTDTKATQLKNQLILSPQPTATPTMQPHSVLSFLPAMLTISKSSLASHSADIILTPPNPSLSSIQITLSYDPGAFQTIDIVPGNIFVQPHVVQKKFNLQEGSITYVLEKQTSLNPSSSLAATLWFIPNPYGVTSNSLPLTQTRISFLPKSAVSVSGVPTSTLDPQTFGNILTIEFATSSAVTR